MTAAYHLICVAAWIGVGALGVSAAIIFVGYVTKPERTKYNDYQ